MFEEHQMVVLLAEVPGHDLKAGDVGTIVHCFESGDAYIVEFTTIEGDTAAVVTVGASTLRAVSARDIAHTRVLDGASH